MLVLAVSNFEKFMDGNNSAQFISSNPQDIKDYFRENGVKYETYIPVYDNYTLVGASVSEHRGVKLAHHFYTTKDGTYIYVFQVCENYFKGDSIILITNDLLNYLKQGNRYRHSHSNYTAIMSHKNNTLFAMVSNAPVSELPESIGLK